MDVEENETKTKQINVAVNDESQDTLSFNFGKLMLHF